jgi:hypothetical protein
MLGLTYLTKRSRTLLTFIVKQPKYFTFYSGSQDLEAFELVKLVNNK